MGERAHEPQDAGSPEGAEGTGEAQVDVKTCPYCTRQIVGLSFTAQDGTEWHLSCAEQQFDEPEVEENEDYE